MVTRGGSPLPPAPAQPALARPASLADWGLALVLCLYPLAGLGLSMGDALTLLGLTLILACGTRLPVEGPLQRPLLASGVCVLLVLLCLWLPTVSTQAMQHPGLTLDQTVRLLLAGVVGLALLRGEARRAHPARSHDRAAALAGFCVVAALLLVHVQGHTGAAAAFGWLAISLGLVFGVYRFHLSTTPGLPMLARTGALGAMGAVLVTLVRGLAS